MLIFNSLDEIKSIKPSVIAFGNFDGIHLGHQEIIKKSVKSAGVSNLKSSVFTFSNHPKNLIKGGMTVKNILYPEEKVEECHKYLGRNYSIGGEVQIGNKIGRTIGFPTSNIIVDDAMVTPSNGVYITICIYNGTRFPSITNAGVKPTIGEYSKNVETHIFHFDKELYGKNIKVEFLQKIRDERKFKDVELLKEQIRKDCLFAKEYHIQNGLL